jgi:hypothetical protein
MEESDSLPPIHTVDLSSLISAIENRRKQLHEPRSSSPIGKVSLLCHAVAWLLLSLLLTRP